MKILTDVHTHTIASAHAYATLTDNVRAAKEKGLELIAMTNHGPAMPDAPHIWHFENIGAVPRNIDGIKVMRGAELNILNKNGEVDLPEYILKKLDIAIASIHTPLYDNREDADHTETWLNVMENPYVDILGHTGRNGYKFDVDAVVKKAKEKNVCIEVNRCTILNPVFREECRKIILSCKKYEAFMTVSSDSHFSNIIGDFDDAISLLSECGFPEELIVNRSADSLVEHLKNKKDFVNYNF